MPSKSQSKSLKRYVIVCSNIISLDILLFFISRNYTSSAIIFMENILQIIIAKDSAWRSTSLKYIMYSLSSSVFKPKYREHLFSSTIIRYSSIKPSCIKVDTMLPLPNIAMFLPGCCFIFEISSAMFSLTSLELFHSTLCSVFKKQFWQDYSCCQQFQDGSLKLTGS
jgi:hypothetical protein